MGRKVDKDGSGKLKKKHYFIKTRVLIIIVMIRMKIMANSIWRPNIDKNENNNNNEKNNNYDNNNKNK